MQTFKDNLGRVWGVALSIGAMRRIKDATKTDLANINEDSFQVVAGDSLRLCEILEHCTQRLDPPGSAEVGGTSGVPLADALSGDALGAARQSFIDELIAFFPSERERAAIARVVSTMNAARDRAMTMVEAQIQSGELDRQLDAAMAEALGETRGESSGSSPASSESTQGTSPSVNST